MVQFLQKSKREALQTISGASDEQLKAESFPETLEKRFLPKPFKFVGEKEVGDVIDIPIEVFFHETGNGGSYSPRDTAQKVEMFKEVEGSSEIFDFMARNSQLPMTNIFQAFSNGNRIGFLYNGYARRITGNAEIQKKLKEDSDKSFTDTERSFSWFNDKLQEFTQRDFRPGIVNAIREEIKRRGDNEAAKDALK